MAQHLCAAERCSRVRMKLKPIRISSIYSITGHRNPYYVPSFRNHIFNEVDQFRMISGVPVAVPHDAERRLSNPGTLNAQHFLANMYLKHPEAMQATARALWKRLWVQDSDISSEDDFNEILREEGLCPKALPMKETEKSFALLRKNEDEALKHGCFDLPFCTVQNGDEIAAFHGNDRWPLIAHKAGITREHQRFFGLRYFNHLYDHCVLTDAA